MIENNMMTQIDRWVTNMIRSFQFAAAFRRKKFNNHIINGTAESKTQTWP